MFEYDWPLIHCNHGRNPSNILRCSLEQNGQIIESALHGLKCPSRHVLRPQMIPQNQYQWWVFVEFSSCITRYTCSPDECLYSEHFDLMDRKLVHNLSSSRFQKCRVFCLIFKTFLLCILKKEHHISQGIYKDTTLFLFLFFWKTPVWPSQMENIVQTDWRSSYVMHSH